MYCMLLFLIQGQIELSFLKFVKVYIRKTLIINRIILMPMVTAPLSVVVVVLMVVGASVTMVVVVAVAFVVQLWP